MVAMGCSWLDELLLLTEPTFHTDTWIVQNHTHLRALQTRCGVVLVTAITADTYM